MGLRSKSNQENYVSTSFCQGSAAWILFQKTLDCWRKGRDCPYNWRFYISIFKQYFSLGFLPKLIEACNEVYFLELAIKFALSLETTFLPSICQACSVNQNLILPILKSFSCIQSKWIQCHLDHTIDSEVSLPSSYDSFHFAFIPFKNLSIMPDFISLAIADSQSPFYTLNLERIASTEFSFNLDQLLKISNMRSLIPRAIKSSRLSPHQICDWLISIIGTLALSDLLNWIESVADINFIEACRVLEASCHLSDVFWNEIANWLSENPNFIRNSSSRIISRIHDIKHLSPSFVLTYSLFQVFTVWLNFLEHHFSADKLFDSVLMPSLFLPKGKLLIATSKYTCFFPYYQLFQPLQSIANWRAYLFWYDYLSFSTALIILFCSLDRLILIAPTWLMHQNFW